MFLQQVVYYSSTREAREQSTLNSSNKKGIVEKAQETRSDTDTHNIMRLFHYCIEIGNNLISAYIRPLQISIG